MGAEQSTHQSPVHHQTQQLRKTETANFDFRHDGTIQRSFLLEGSGGESRNEGRQEKINKENRDKNYYWLEVGMDVVKKID